MISFKDIELQDKELITSYTQNSPRRNCDLSFSNLCSWRFYTIQSLPSWTASSC